MGNSVILPGGYSENRAPVVIRPILLPTFSVNKLAPSGPGVTSSGRVPEEGSGNSVRMPPTAIRPIALPVFSANQTLPSAPAAIPLGPLPAVVTGYSLKVWAPATEAEPSNTRVRTARSSPGRRGSEFLDFWMVTPRGLYAADPRGVEAFLELRRVHREPRRTPVFAPILRADCGWSRPMAANAGRTGFRTGSLAPLAILLSTFVSASEA